jgi:hypothetical protein
MTVPATAAWKMAENTLSASAPGAVDTTAKVPLGTIRRFRDVTYGEGEFIYLLGVASTVAGDPVTWTAATFATTRAVAGAGIPMAVAFATAATVASTYGWYQISGLAIANKTKTVSMAAGIAVGISTTALIAASSSSKEIQGARTAIVASATTTTNNGGKVVLSVSRPFLQGQDFRA